MPKKISLTVPIQLRVDIFVFNVFTHKDESLVGTLILGEDYPQEDRDFILKNDDGSEVAFRCRDGKLLWIGGKIWDLEGFTEAPDTNLSNMATLRAKGDAVVRRLNDPDG